MSPRGVDPVFSTTTPIRYKDAEGGGTGFFLNYNDNTFLVTNSHVVNPADDDVNPTEAYIWLRNATDIGQTNRMAIRFVKEESPTWYDHPAEPDEIDIAVIPLNPRLSSLDDVFDKDESVHSGSLAFTPDYFLHKNINVDQRVSIIGYPGDFMDRTTRFPLRRNALIASPYGYGFGDRPFFLTDARMHPGTSGSPVVMNAGGMQRVHGDVPDHRSKSLYLLGIHSATFYATGFEEHNQEAEDGAGNKSNEQEFKLDLNAAWYPQLITDILDSL